jgi:hypothetical protein
MSFSEQDGLTLCSSPSAREDGVKQRHHDGTYGRCMDRCPFLSDDQIEDEPGSRQQRIETDFDQVVETHVYLAHTLALLAFAAIAASSRAAFATAKGSSDHRSLDHFAAGQLVRRDLYLPCRRHDARHERRRDRRDRLRDFDQAERGGVLQVDRQARQGQRQEGLLGRNHQGRPDDDEFRAVPSIGLRLHMCAQENFDACIGPFKRVHGQSI